METTEHIAGAAPGRPFHALVVITVLCTIFVVVWISLFLPRIDETIVIVDWAAALMWWAHIMALVALGQILMVSLGKALHSVRASKVSKISNKNAAPSQ